MQYYTIIPNHTAIYVAVSRTNRMGEIKQLKHCIDKAHYHHTENGVPLTSAIQTVADTSQFTFTELQTAYNSHFSDTKTK